MRYVSNSEIQTFKRCRRKWWLGHFRKLRLKRGIARKPREVGDVVHRRLDRYYQGGMTDDVLKELKLDVKRMHKQFPGQEKEVQGIAELSRIMVEGYFEWLEDTGADAHLEVIAPEQNVYAPLSEDLEDVALIGKLDVRVKNLQTGARQFLETKTVGNFDDMIKTAHMNEQLYEYHLLEQMTGDEDIRSDGTVLNMLKRVKRTKAAKPPFFMRHPVPHNLDELRLFYRRVVGTVRELLRLEGLLAEGVDPLLVAYPTQDRSCTWSCDFFDVCPKFDNPHANVEGMVELMFEEHDPMERYDALLGKESD